jgi:ubiquinone/menaquinone biosynthesis C-methylase UbiE
MPDWGLGHYEVIAAEVEPVARRVVAMAGPLRGERVLDIGCGTGNAALLAAQLGATVTGVDEAPRLIEVAGRRAAAEHLDISFVVGDAEHLDFPDASFDVVVSVFGIIFAPSAGKAFSEMVRVLRPGARAFFTAWLPEGAIDAMAGVFIRAVNAATGSASPPRFAWHDPSAVGQLAGGRPVTVTTHEGELEFLAASPEEFLARNQANHPMRVAMKPLLEKAGNLESMEEETLGVLRNQNEDPGGFRVTSRYRIFEVHRLM